MTLQPASSRMATQRPCFCFGRHPKFRINGTLVVDAACLQSRGDTLFTFCPCRLLVLRISGTLEYVAYLLSTHADTTSMLCFRRVDRNKYQIQIPLPPKIDPTVTMMTVEEKPDVTYSDIGGCKEQVDSCMWRSLLSHAAHCMAVNRQAS